MLAKVYATRWMSVVDRSEEYLKILNVPASEALIKFVAEDFDGEGSQRWEGIARLCTCIDDDNKLSHCILCFLYIGNHSPGGTSGDGYRNASQLVAFMTAPLQHIAIAAAAALKPKQAQWTAFMDKKSKLITTARIGSTKAIELPVFERDMLTSLHAAAADWKSWSRSHSAARTAGWSVK